MQWGKHMVSTACVGSRTIATSDERGTTTTLPFIRFCLRALASALRWWRGRKARTATYEKVDSATSNVTNPFRTHCSARPRVGGGAVLCGGSADR